MPERKEMDMRICKKTTALVLTGAAILLGMAGCGTSNPGTGARDGDISIVAREEGSGTRGAFVEIMGVVDADGWTPPYRRRRW